MKQKLINQLYLLKPEICSHLIAKRYTRVKYGKVENILLVNERNINAGIVLLDKDYLERSKNVASKTIFVHNLNEWSSSFDELEPSSVCCCYRTVRQTYENAVVEGFNDAVSPEPRILRGVDVVVGVAPGVAVFYDSEDFGRVIKAMAKLGEDPRTLRAEEVVKFIRVDNLIDIPPLSQEYLIDYDRLSKKLKNIIDYAKSILKP